MSKCELTEEYSKTKPGEVWSVYPSALHRQHPVEATMSAETKAALDTALAAHIADECKGALLTSYVCQTEFTSMELIDEEMTGYQRMIAEGQTLTTTLGLMHYGQRMLDEYTTATLEPDDD